jgi:hypothetical protein
MGSMGKGSAPQAPQAPDFSGLAQQQGQQNMQNSYAQWLMNNTSQSNPWASKGLVSDPNSPTGFSQATVLNPADQARLDQQRGVQSGMMGGAQQMLAQMLGGGSGSPTNYMNANGAGLSPGGGGGNASGIGTYSANDPFSKLNALQAEGGYTDIGSGNRNSQLSGNPQTMGQYANVAGTYNDIGSNVGVLGDPSGTGEVSTKVNPWTMKGMQNVDFTGLGQPIQNVAGGDIQMGLQDPNAVRDAATKAAYGNWADINEPQFQRAQDAERTRIANMGGVSTSVGAQNAMGDLAQQQNLARNNAINQATITGGDQAAQNMSMQNLAGQFANLAQGQQFGQGMQNAGLYNQGIQQLMQMMTGQAGFNNANVQQGMANELEKIKAKTQGAGALAGASASMHGSDLAAQTAANNLALEKMQAMYNMGSVQQPQFAGMGQFNSTPTNIYGAGQDQYAAANNAYQGQMANYNNQQAGTGSLISTGIMTAGMMIL